MDEDEEHLRDLLQIYNALGREINILRENVKSRGRSKASTYPISDHAILRWLERVHRMDIEAIKKEILTPDRMAAVKLGAHRIKTGDYTIIIADNTVVTVLSKEQLREDTRTKERQYDDEEV